VRCASSGRSAPLSRVLSGRGRGCGGGGPPDRHRASSAAARRPEVRPLMTRCSTTCCRPAAASTSSVRSCSHVASATRSGRRTTRCQRSAGDSGVSQTQSETSLARDELPHLCALQRLLHRVQGKRDRLQPIYRRGLSSPTRRARPGERRRPSLVWRRRRALLLLDAGRRRVGCGARATTADLHARRPVHRERRTTRR